MEIFIRMTITLSIIFGIYTSFAIGSVVPLILFAGAGAMICISVIVCIVYAQVLVDSVKALFASHEDYIP